jgi:hypothetical protein
MQPVLAKAACDTAVCRIIRTLMKLGSILPQSKISFHHGKMLISPWLTQKYYFTRVKCQFHYGKHQSTMVKVSFTMGNINLPHGNRQLHHDKHQFTMVEVNFTMVNINLPW